MLGVIRKIFSRKDDVTFSDWIIEDYLEYERIEDIEIDGTLRKVSAQRHFKRYAEYETNSGVPYAPEVNFKDINVIFYPLFIVIESCSTMPDSFFIVMRPPHNEKYKIKTTIQLLSIKAEDNLDDVMAPMLRFLTENVAKVQQASRQTK